MSLFDDFKQGAIIEKPKQLGSYARINKAKKETEEERVVREKQERKELLKQKKEELSPEEYRDFMRKTYYQSKKQELIDKQLEWYERTKKESDVMLEEIYKELYDVLPEPIDLDDYYQEKFKPDNVNKEGKYRFGWRHSRCMDLYWPWLPKLYHPIRICNRWGMTHIMSRTLSIENKAYQYLLPHMGEISLSDFWLKRRKRQIVSKYPYRNMKGKMKELAEATDIPHSHLCNVASAILRGRYIVSEVYLGRTNFLIGDIIVTQTGGLFQVSLKNNFKWLTEETIEDIHKKREDWIHVRSDEKPPIYMLEDAYLMSVKPNEWEEWFYIVPYGNVLNSRGIK